MHTAPSRRAVAVVASVLALTACGALSPGGDFVDQSPRSMAEAAFADMQEVTSLRILGSQESDDGFTRVDIRVGDAGCTGSLDSDRGRISVLKNGEGAWISGDENFWLARTASPQQAKNYAGGWLATPKKNGFLELCNLAALLSGFALDEDDTEDTIEAGEVVEIGDTDTVPVTGQEGKQRITAWVAVESPHLVLKMAPADDRGRPDELFFEEFGADVVAESPSKQDIIKVPGALT